MYYGEEETRLKHAIFRFFKVGFIDPIKRDSGRHFRF